MEFQVAENRKKQTKNMKQKLQEAIDLLEQLVYYSQIHTVSGVRPAGFDTHDEAWKKAQKFIRDNCEIVDGKYITKASSESENEENSQRKTSNT
jgi:NTP pyrophosphatase (non-canonical NTP hydrolase)